MQDIGILVLLRELGEPYAKFLTGVIDEKCHLASLEQDTLGFDHVQLSAALLARWQLPKRLVEAIAAPKKVARLSRMASPEGDLPQILHLAEMLMQLVGQRRLGVLSDLLEAGKLYRGMTKSKLALLVEGLQPQVDQLAASLSLELTEERDYVQMLLDAQQQMAALGELIAGESASTTKEDQAYTQLLAHTNELSDAMRSFLKTGKAPDKDGKQWNGKHAAHSEDAGQRLATVEQFAECKDGSALVRKLIAAANRCRERRQELSLMLGRAECVRCSFGSYGRIGAKRHTACARRCLRGAGKREGHSGIAERGSAGRNTRRIASGAARLPWRIRRLRSSARALSKASQGRVICPPL